MIILNYHGISEREPQLLEVPLQAGEKEVGRLGLKTAGNIL